MSPSFEIDAYSPDKIAERVQRVSAATARETL